MSLFISLLNCCNSGGEAQTIFIVSNQCMKKQDRRMVRIISKNLLILPIKMIS